MANRRQPRATELIDVEGMLDILEDAILSDVPTITEKRLVVNSKTRS